MFCVPCDHAIGEVSGHQHRRHSRMDQRAFELRPRDLADRAVQLLRIGKINRFDVAIVCVATSSGFSSACMAIARENAELGARVETVNIGGWIRFGITELLRVRKHRRILGAASMRLRM